MCRLFANQADIAGPGPVQIPKYGLMEGAAEFGSIWVSFSVSITSGIPGRAHGSLGMLVNR